MSSLFSGAGIIGGILGSILGGAPKLEQGPSAAQLEAERKKEEAAAERRVLLGASKARGRQSTISTATDNNIIGQNLYSGS